MDFMKVFMDLVRTFFWFLTTAFLSFFDMIFEAIQNIATIDISQFDFIWQWWGALCMLLYFFIAVRMIVRFLRTLVDDDILERFDPVKMIARIAAVAIIIGLLPNILGALSNVSTIAIQNIDIMTGNDGAKASQIIVNGARQDGDKDIADWKQIEINDYKKDEKKYNYFNDTWQIVFLLASSATGCVIMIFIGLQIAQRLVGLAFKVLLSPYALSGIVDPDDRTWSTWCKLVLGDLLTNFYQMLLVLLALTLIPAIQISGLAHVIFLLGALMAVMNAPSGVAQILGSDIGVGTALQQMQTLNMMGHVMSSGASLVGAAATTTAAAGIYGTGRVLGGQSLLSTMGRSNAGFNQSSEGWTMRSDGDSGSTIGEETGSYAAGSAASGSGGGSIRRGADPMVRAGSVLDRIDRTCVRNSGADRGMTRCTKSLYAKSAERLARPVQTRTARGTMMTRDSRFVQASHAYHSLKGDGHRGGEGEDNE